MHSSPKAVTVRYFKYAKCNKNSKRNMFFFGCICNGYPHILMVMLKSGMKTRKKT